MGEGTRLLRCYRDAVLLLALLRLKKSVCQVQKELFYGNPGVVPLVPFLSRIGSTAEIPETPWTVWKIWNLLNLK